ncbi:MAG: hypothetical protein QM785_18190 [Pyrinomonadaceae bacterium]
MQTSRRYWSSFTAIGLVLNLWFSVVLVPGTASAQIQIRPNPKNPARKMITLPKAVIRAPETRITENILDTRGFKRVAIPFKAFSRVSKSGKPLDPNRMIKLPNGKTITAKEFFDQADLMEQELNKRGHSFRESEPFAALARTVPRAIRADPVVLPDNLQQISLADYEARKKKAESSQAATTNGPFLNFGLIKTGSDTNFGSILSNPDVLKLLTAPTFSVQTGGTSGWGEVSPIKNGNFTFLVKVLKSEQSKIQNLQWSVTNSPIKDYSTNAGDVLKAGLVKGGSAKPEWVSDPNDPQMKDTKNYAYATLTVNFDQVAKQPPSVLQTYYIRLRAVGPGYDMPSRSVTIYYGKSNLGVSILRTFNPDFEGALAAAQNISLPLAGGIISALTISDFKECLLMSDEEFETKPIVRNGITLTCSDPRLGKVKYLRSFYPPFPLEQNASIEFPDKYPSVKLVFGRYAEGEKVGKVKQLNWQITSEPNWDLTDGDKPRGLVKSGTVSVGMLKVDTPYSKLLGNIASELDYWDFPLDLRSALPDPTIDQTKAFYIRVIPVLANGTKLPPSSEIAINYKNNNKEYEILSPKSKGGFDLKLPNSDSAPFGLFAKSDGLQTFKNEKVTKAGKIPLGYKVRANAVFGFRHYNLANIIGEQPVSYPKDLLNLEFVAAVGVGTGPNKTNEEQGAKLVVNSFLMQKAETIWLTEHGPAIQGEFPLEYDIDEPFDKEIFNTLLFVGPVPLRVTAGVKGAYGIKMYGVLKTGSMNVKGSIRPFAYASMYGRAEATALIASAGMQLDIDLVNAELILAYDGETSDGLDFSGNISALKGKLFVYVRFYYPCLDWEEDFVCEEVLPYPIFEMKDYLVNKPFGSKN